LIYTDRKEADKMAADKKDKVERKTELDSKKEALASALKKIEKDFGKGSIMRLGDAQARMNVEVIPTGILPLDIALGIGGVPRGRIIEIYGP
jgi:recombination protein RecA